MKIIISMPPLRRKISRSAACIDGPAIFKAYSFQMSQATGQPLNMSEPHAYVTMDGKPVSMIPACNGPQCKLPPIGPGGSYVYRSSSNRLAQEAENCSVCNIAGLGVNHPNAANLTVNSGCTSCGGMAIAIANPMVTATAMKAVSPPDKGKCPCEEPIQRAISTRTMRMI